MTGSEQESDGKRPQVRERGGKSDRERGEEGEGGGGSQNRSNKVRSIDTIVAHTRGAYLDD